MAIVHAAVFYRDHVLLRHYHHSAAYLSGFNQVYLKLVSDKNVVGFAEVRGNCPYVTHEKREDILASIRSVGLKLLAGHGERPLDYVLSGIYEGVSSSGAKTLLDVALHDLEARENQVPLYELLGGKRRDAIPGFLGIGFADLEETTRMLSEGLDAGFGWFKVRVGVGTLDQDLERLALVRKMAPDHKIAVDANRAWSVEDAIRNIQKMSVYDLMFAEQPVDCNGVEGLRHVREAVDVPIMADESMMGPQDLDRLVSAGAIDMVNIKLLKAGGVFGVTRVIQKACAHGIPFLFGGMSSGSLDMAATLHVQCSVGADAKWFAASTRKFVGGDPTSGLTMTNGEVRIPEGPGLGVSIDESMLDEQFSADY